MENSEQYSIKSTYQNKNAESESEFGFNSRFKRYATWSTVGLIAAVVIILVCIAISPQIAIRWLR